MVQDGEESCDEVVPAIVGGRVLEGCQNADVFSSSNSIVTVLQLSAHCVVFAKSP
jgi:hypothetical protein